MNYMACKVIIQTKKKMLIIIRVCYNCYIRYLMNLYNIRVRGYYTSYASLSLPFTYHYYINSVLHHRLSQLYYTQYNIVYTAYTAALIEIG